MKNGFTLIELTLVIAIIAIMAVLFLPKLFDIKTSANEKTALAVQASIEETINLLEMRKIITGQNYTAQDVIDNMTLQGVTLTVEDL